MVLLVSFICGLCTILAVSALRIGQKQNRIPTRVSEWRRKSSLDDTETKSVAVVDDGSYGAQSITVLKGLEPVRKRPGMYIGSTSQKGLHHLVYEVVDNSVDESLAGHCTKISITLQDDGTIEVQDNGRGIPCSLHPSTGKSSLETVLCVLHAGGKFGGEDSGYKVSGGLHGVGLSVVNALSEHLFVEVVRDNVFHTMSFAKGIPVTEMSMRPSLTGETRGTKVIFKPDDTIFKTTTYFDYDKLAARMDELAYLNAGLTLEFTDNRSAKNRKPPKAHLSEYSDEGDEDGGASSADKDTPAIDKKIGKYSPENNDPIKEIPPRVETFLHQGGLRELVLKMTEDKTLLHQDAEVIYINVDAEGRSQVNSSESSSSTTLGSGKMKGVSVEIAMRWNRDQYVDSLSGFANGIRTSDGGSHLDGLKAAITKTINAYGRKLGKLKDGNLPGEFVREGLTAVVSVKIPEPEFEGQTKTRLGNPEVRQVVDSVVADALSTLFEWYPQILNDILKKAMDAQQAAVAAKAARDMVRRKSLLTSTVLPGKLADCASRDPSESEVYIVEGDSAAGSAKQGRDRATQAILPLRGKILNIEKASNDRIYQNTELQALISALGLGVRGEAFDADRLRYHRIVIMTDADVDGAHIRLLILTFLHRYQRELIEGGYVYVACPPLYKVVLRGKEIKYLYDQAAMDAFMKTLPENASPTIQRFKGLGEMMPTQLWETTMDPSKRILKLVSIEDAVAADRLFSVLMGDNVQSRKEFITNNVESMLLSDIDF